MTTTSHQPLDSYDLDWKGKRFHLEFIDSEDFSTIQPITQAQAVPFVDEGTIVLFRHIDGYWSLPGGSIEMGESIEQTLKRELMEEASLEIIHFGKVGYMKTWQLSKPDEISYQTRWWAEVKLLDQPIQDPCGKAIGREAFPVSIAIEKLNWGERGRVLVELALRKYKTWKDSKKM